MHTHQPMQPPLNPGDLSRRKSRWARRLERYLNEDPEITVKGKIGVMVKREGLFGRVITLTGLATSRKERERAEQIIRVNASRNIRIENHIALASDSP